MSGPNQPKQQVFVVSDGTGETAQKVARAALRQFGDPGVALRAFGQVTDANRLEPIFRLASRQSAMVVTTLVSGEVRRAADRLARELGVAHVDLLGRLLHTMGQFLAAQPAEVPGLLHQADDAYFKRIAAIEFTVRADDGALPGALAQADIVLIGVSRTGKTPLSHFLAQKGYKVANQPIVLERPIPDALFQADSRRVFALTIAADKLRQIRRNRLAALRMGAPLGYQDRDTILAELEHAENLARGMGWPVIDVTDKAIEETAAIILRELRDHGLAPDGVPA